MSGQDEQNRALWLATQAGKELSCPLGTTRRVPREKFQPNNKSFIDQAFSVKMAGYWPPPRSINKQKKNEANIQPSWPHAWSKQPIFSASDDAVWSRVLFIPEPRLGAATVKAISPYVYSSLRFALGPSSNLLFEDLSVLRESLYFYMSLI